MTLPITPIIYRWNLKLFAIGDTTNGRKQYLFMPNTIVGLIVQYINYLWPCSPTSQRIFIITVLHLLYKLVYVCHKHQTTMKIINVNEFNVAVILFLTTIILTQGSELLRKRSGDRRRTKHTSLFGTSYIVAYLVLL